MAVQMVEDEPVTRLKLVPTNDGMGVAGGINDHVAWNARQPDRPEVARPAPRHVTFPAREVMSALEWSAKALSLRLLLFAGAAAASWLGYLVVDDPKPARICALGIWAAFIYLPVVALNARRQ